MEPSDTIWVGNLPMESDEASVTTIFTAYGHLVRVSVLPVSNGRGAAIIQLTNVAEATWIVQNLNGNIAQGLTEPIVAKFAKRPSGPRLPGGQSTAAAPATPVATAAAVRSSPYPSGGGYGEKGGGGYGGKSGGGIGPGGGTIDELLLSMLKNGSFPQMDRSMCMQLYISGLPPDTTDQDLYKMFTPFACPIMPNGVKAMLMEDGSCTGVGFVDVYDTQAAQAAIASLNGLPLEDGRTLRVQQKRNQGKGGGSWNGGKW
mmetsp:Transcript_43335/g.85854  ORF Transcript_43335/g.85854 Transcript_43335/m.85854 type:complete len:259 (+) Transcript_43335:78-854(+)